MLALLGTAARLWFFQNWMYAGLIAGLFLLAVLPLLADGWSQALVAVFLMLPAYLLHQVEEHAGDRFRRFINTRVAKVPNALTTRAVVVINVPLVWGVDLVAIYLARYVAIGLGLIAIYLTLVNAIVHVVGAAALRCYN
ncbi:MAG TPA: HXXEE domain-containing protein, partial [Bauldia sp.]|nr:HXXEE domain-containing protein [Bauldia sp.]